MYYRIVSNNSCMTRNLPSIPKFTKSLFRKSFFYKSIYKHFLCRSPITKINTKQEREINPISLFVFICVEWYSFIHKKEAPRWYFFSYLLRGYLRGWKNSSSTLSLKFNFIHILIRFFVIANFFIKY